MTTPTPAQPQTMQEYLEERRQMVDLALQVFISEQYQGKLLEEMAVHVITGGKRARGTMSVMVCEALGGSPADALVAACAVELCHACSLVKDDVQDHDERRRGGLSFWKLFGLEMATLLPDVIVPHVALFTKCYGWQALGSVIGAWASLGRGQLMDNLASPATSSGLYDQIIMLKTAPLYECACELGVRASRKDWFLGPAKGYGKSAGAAFQVYDDVCDLYQAQGQPWESMAKKGPLPSSMQALKSRLHGIYLVRWEDVTAAAQLGEAYLNQAAVSALAFPDSPIRQHLVDLPAASCRALVLEVIPQEIVDAGKIPGIPAAVKADVP